MKIIFIKNIIIIIILVIIYWNYYKNYYRMWKYKKQDGMIISVVVQYKSKRNALLSMRQSCFPKYQLPNTTCQVSHYTESSKEQDQRT